MRTDTLLLKWPTEAAIGRAWPDLPDNMMAVPRYGVTRERYHLRPKTTVTVVRGLGNYVMINLNNVSLAAAFCQRRGQGQNAL